MHQPSIGALLSGLRKGLADSVLPALPKGAAQKQLRAALHLIGRLERCWDVPHSHLAADNADIEAVLSARIDPASLEKRLAEFAAAPPSGYNDPALAAAAARNIALHALLADLGTKGMDGLDSLYRRLSERDSILMGDRKAGN